MTEALLIRSCYSGIEELPKNIPQDVINKLKNWFFLNTHEKLEEFDQFCTASEYKEVQSKHPAIICETKY